LPGWRRSLNEASSGCIVYLASQEAARGLVSSASVVTTALYTMTVSQALRSPVSERWKLAFSLFRARVVAHVRGAGKAATL
jgi:hypothetical protein